MIRIKGRGAVYGEFWYGEAVPKNPKIDIAVHLQRHAPIPGARSVQTLTLITDLEPPPDAIRDNFTDRCRYEIRRAEGRDELEYECPEAPAERLDEFADFYDAFAAQKSLPRVDRLWLRSACEAGALLLTAARRRNEVLVWHAYVIAGRIGRCQYSASCFRHREGSFRSLVGRANRWLHWRDMLQLKEMGMERYDWGGIFGDDGVPEHASVDGFKKGFNGRPMRAYNCAVPVSWKGRIYLPLREAWRRRGKKHWDELKGKLAGA